MHYLINVRFKLHAIIKSNPNLLEIFKVFKIIILIQCNGNLIKFNHFIFHKLVYKSIENANEIHFISCAMISPNLQQKSLS